ncbi:glycosyltransferase family 2 protein [Actinomyces minihominis]|uniref:glycosyltransferase family 2 protein n=1 Tax=Actinomyces minihominis TaxID=2002838 RepID=UPI000C07A682|nr:glycosyltransferase family 2 protein [Actinomyces minihominis]
MSNGTRTTAVVVTYNPDASELTALLSALLPQVSTAVVVDNGSKNEGAVAEITSNLNAVFLPLGENLGIATAQNRGITWAMKRGTDYVLLSDQDSVPAPDMVEKLRECFENPPLPDQPTGLTLLSVEDEEGLAQFPGSVLTGPVAAVGPVPLDDRGGEVENALVYSFTKWGAMRRQVPGPGQALAVPFVLASGCLISVEALREVGPMNGSLFIDHVDLAWCLRALEDGYRILVTGDALIYHSLGDEVAKVPGRKQPVHLHSAVRNYYIMRNTLLLQSASFLPSRWKRRYLMWMVKYMGYYILAPGRRQRVPLLTRGVRDGIMGRVGPQKTWKRSR